MNSFTTNLQINIDEFTFIIFHKEKILLRTWEECAKTIIYEFVKNSNIDVVFDGKVNEKIGGNLPYNMVLWTWMKYPRVLN